MNAKIHEYLWLLRNFQHVNLPFLESLEDIEIVVLVGLYQERGTSITMKEIHAFSIGTKATVERRIARLKELGVILSTRRKNDLRFYNLRLSAKVMRSFQQYANVLMANADRLIG